MRENCNRFFSISTLLLIILVIVFHTELFVFGVRLYAAVKKSPKAERLLGDYYANASHLDNNRANAFYVSSMAKNKETLSDEDPETQARANYQMGRFYECGKGVKPDANEAKKWYTTSQQILKAQKIEGPLDQEAQEGLDRVEKSIKDNTPLEPCPYQSNWHFMKNTFRRD